MISFNESLANVVEDGGIAPDDSWRQGKGVFGGLIAGAFIRAFEQRLLEEANDVPSALRSLRLQLRAPLPDEMVAITTGVGRTGKYVTYLDGTMGEDGSIAVASAVVVRPTKANVDFEDVEPPTVPHIESIKPWPQSDLMSEFTKYFEFRSCLGRFPYSAARNDVEVGGWVRFRDDDDPMDTARLAALADAWPLSIMVAASQPAPAASMEIGYQFWDEPEPASRWVLVRNRSTVSRGGYADQETHVWSQDGRLLVTARQLAVLLG